MNQTINTSQQDEWRIKPIHHRDPMAMMQTNWWALIGALLFVGSVVVSLSIDKGLILISVFGFFISLVSLYLGYRKKTKSWEIVTASCVDREWKQVISRPGMKGGTRKIWTFMLLCEFKIADQRYSVTPTYWSPTFLTEKRLKKFLNKVITSDSRCRLRVNLDNPLQTELVADGLVEKLLRWPG